MLWTAWSKSDLKNKKKFLNDFPIKEKKNMEKKNVKSILNLNLEIFAIFFPDDMEKKKCPPHRKKNENKNLTLSLFLKISKFK